MKDLTFLSTGNVLPDLEAKPARRPRIAAVIVGLLIFIVDTWTPVHDAFAVLYVLIVLLIANSHSQRTILATGAGCIVVSVVSFLLKHYGEAFNGSYIRLGVSIVAIAVATSLSSRDRRTRSALAEQVRMLAFTHDTVIVRDLDDIIIYWNEGATQLYGWHADEAIGAKGSALLRSLHLPNEAAEQIRISGQWSGEITRTRRDGQQIVLDTRWILRLDSNGNGCGIIEFGADLTEQKQAAVERERSERRYGAIFQAVGFAILEVDFLPLARALPALDATLPHNPTIRDANGAAAALLGATDPRDLVNMPLRMIFVDHQVFTDITTHIAHGGVVYETETPFMDHAGNILDMLVRVTRAEADTDCRRVLVMGLDITERKQAQVKLRAAQAELAHADRVTTLGQLAVSIAHEVNQPLAAITNFARSGRRWLDRPAPNLAEALASFDQIGSNSTRAADVITRVRAMTRKEPGEHVTLDLDVMVEEVTALLRGEIRAGDIAVKTIFADGTPRVSGDRIQIQQIIMNVMINAFQAMHDIVDRPRILTIHMAKADATGTAALIRFDDTGPGFGNLNATDLFEPFVTTKAQGMGMGLSICREIVSAHRGTIDAANADPFGAIIRIILPAAKTVT